MKKTLSLSAALLTVGAIWAQSSVQSGDYIGVAVSSISDNGQWMVCEGAQEGSTIIYQLGTNAVWRYINSGTMTDKTYTTGFTRTVSNDGVVVGEVADIPSYWKDGEWYELKGWKRDNTGYVAAAIGAITPDGSVIVGSMGKGNSIMGSEDDAQYTYPCVWYRQEDGSYGDPVWLPNEGRDLFGRIPQYLNCIAVSADGKTIGAIMRSASGYFHFPIVYTLNDNGEWESTMLGMDLINPNNVVPYPSPGDYYGPDRPNYEAYMTAEQIQEFYYSEKSSAWIEDLIRKGYSDEEIGLLELSFAMEFMSPEAKAEYEVVLNEFLDKYLTWQEQWNKYVESREEIISTGMDFEFNNIHISPDGKYVYASGKAGWAGSYTPVRFEVGTSNYTLYPNNINMILTCITENYDILGTEANADADMYRTAYIIPNNDTKPIPLYEYYKDNSAIYEWMEEKMYQSVVVSVTATGADQFDDEWSMGKPIATPSMDLIGFSTSMLYWEAPISQSSYLVTFLLNTSEMSGIEGVESVDEDFSLAVLPNSSVELSKTVNEINVFDLSGNLLYKKSNVAGVLNTGLSSGVYIIKVTLPDGTEKTRKAMF